VAGQRAQPKLGDGSLVAGLGEGCLGMQAALLGAF